MANLGATNLRHYMSGTDGTVPGIGGCPFDMALLQHNYQNGSITPSQIINFGGSGGLTTGVSMQVNVLDIYNGEEILDVIACAGYQESSAVNYRVPNLHRPGAARASDVWVVIPQNIVVPKLIKKLHEGAVDQIWIASLAFLETGSEPKPTIVNVHDYTSCFIKFVDALSYAALAVFAFSFTKVKITQVDYLQISSGGANAKTGQYVYEFNYNSAQGTGS